VKPINLYTITFSFTETSSATVTLPAENEEEAVAKTRGELEQYGLTDIDIIQTQNVGVFVPQEPKEEEITPAEDNIVHFPQTNTTVH
jgi:hypothetical protein